ncbi:TIGR04282 family arsenosugar biosynthesis glycosyltransferase [Saccharopolyspora sp. 5N708]|uniref:TIGR04282 family arsenosugar biosynthesis glycosyltransferase n=1 Tax=Saccharopolyspora sp. 5N708 TaxID=3457424 RepID=UPI003FD26B9B
MVSTTALLVVAKAPVPGLAKTRLCPPATHEEAARVAAASLLDTLDAVASTPRVHPVVALAGDLNAATCSTELRAALHGWTVLDQRGDSFPRRLAAAHADTAAAHPGLPIVQIGMDTPQVTPELLAEACSALRAADAALGLADDGGWWVAGFRSAAAAELLGAIPTSRDDTGARTLAALRAAGLRVAPLPRLSDVDTMADALRVADSLPSSRFAASLPAGCRR